MNIISQAQAQEVQNPATEGEFSVTSFVPLLLIFAIFYLLIIRPQSKKIKEHQSLVNAVKKGDKIITNSGIIGKIKDIDTKENIISLEIADDVVIQVVKNNIAEVVESKKDNKKSKKEKK